MSVILEIAVTSAADATRARSAGADRVELCAALELGGITPSLAEVEAAVSAGVSVSVLVRSRPGDFVFEPEELAVMAADVRHVVRAGATGVVIGALQADRSVDRAATSRLIDAALEEAPEAELTFHRALDHTADPLAAFEAIGALGMTRVLTSGGRHTASAGIDVIRAMAASGSTVQVMAGGGVRVHEMKLLADAGVDAVHLSAKRAIAAAAAGVALGARDTAERFVVDRAIVAAARAELDRVTA